jgi:hypothetical protein
MACRQKFAGAMLIYPFYGVVDNAGKDIPQVNVQAQCRRHAGFT